MKLGSQLCGVAFQKVYDAGKYGCENPVKLARCVCETAAVGITLVVCARALTETTVAAMFPSLTDRVRPLIPSLERVDPLLIVASVGITAVVVVRDLCHLIHHYGLK